MKVSLIAAVGANGVIGDGTGMPWRLSTDMKRFRQITMGKPIIVGRTTFETFGKALPGRTNIVVTRRAGYRPAGALVAGSPDAALELAGDVLSETDGDEAMVVGGGEIYAATLAHADRLYITHVAAEPTGTAHFPPIDPALWRVVSREAVPRGERDTAATLFTIYEPMPEPAPR